jgi:integron integrase
MELLPDSELPKPRLLDQVRQRVKVRGYAQSTEDAYCYWIKRYILHHNKRHPSAMAIHEVEQFLCHLADVECVSASTQNQALSAILFLYKHVLNSPLEQRIQASRAKHYKHLPTVLSVGEVRRLLAEMTGTMRLMAELTYGAGLRLLEVHCIRVGHLDFEAKRVQVLDGKGRKDRYTFLPDDLVRPIQRQLALVAETHAEDLLKGLGDVILPRAFFRKSKEASHQLRWQFLFPSKSTFHDARTGNSGRWHVNPSGLQNAVRNAAERANLNKRVTVHTLRHSFATHLLHDGCDIRTLQALLGHSHVNTTMLYAHIDDNFSLKARSPFDSHALHQAPGDA